MNGRNVEQDLSEFFHRVTTPEPSLHLRDAVAAARLAPPAGRMAAFQNHRTTLSLIGLAASVVLAAGLVLLATSRGGRNVAAPNLSPTTTASRGPAGTFVPTGSMTSSRAGATAALLSDGRVLIAAGWADNQTPLASAELYNPSTGTFSPTGSMTTARNGTATLLPDGRVLFAGGSDQTGTV